MLLYFPITVDVRGIRDWLREQNFALVVGVALLPLAAVWALASCLGFAVRWFGLSIFREHGADGPTLRRVHGAHGRQARSRQYVRHLLVALVCIVAIVIEQWVLGVNVLTLPADRAVKLGVVVIAMPLALVTAELRCRRLGHALTSRYLVSCTGTITATRTALQTEGIVGWRIHQSLWDRRRGIAQLTATTAAGETQVLLVPDIPLGEAVAVAAAATPHTVKGFLASSAL